MDWIFVVLIIAGAVINIAGKNKKKQEAARKAQQQPGPAPAANVQQEAAPARPVAVEAKARSRAAMVEEQRRKAQAYSRQQGRPVNVPDPQSDIAPWKRSAASSGQAPSPAQSRPVAQRLERPPVNPPAAATAALKRQSPPPVRTGIGPQLDNGPVMERAIVTPLPVSGGKEQPGFHLRQSGEDWRRAIVLAEILAPPKALRNQSRNGRSL